MDDLGGFVCHGWSYCGNHKTPMRVGQKRGRPVEAPENVDVFPSIHDLPASELLEQEEDVVYCDPYRRNMLFCMHHLSTPRAPRTLRYTSMARRRHLGTKKYVDCIERYKRRAGNSVQLKEADNRLSQFDARSLSPHTFEDFIIERGVAVNILGLFYENIVFHKWRKRTQIGAERDYTKLARILRNKFGRNPVLVVGNTRIKSARFHSSTLGVARTGLGAMATSNQTEIHHLNALDAWTLTTVPVNQKLVRSRWVFKKQVGD
jgi:hypothetical protein